MLFLDISLLALRPKYTFSQIQWLSLADLAYLRLHTIAVIESQHDVEDVLMFRSGEERNEMK